MILFNISGYALHFVVFLRFSTLKTVVVTFYKNLIIPCSSQLRMFLSRLVTAHPLFYLNRRHPYIHLFILYVSTCIYFIFHNLSIEESHNNYLYLNTSEIIFLIHRERECKLPTGWKILQIWMKTAF